MRRARGAGRRHCRCRLLPAAAAALLSARAASAAGGGVAAVLLPCTSGSCPATALLPCAAGCPVLPAVAPCTAGCPFASMPAVYSMAQGSLLVQMAAVMHQYSLVDVSCTKGGTCTCPDTDECRIVCTKCEGTQITCSKVYPCDITCDGKKSCKEATISGWVNKLTCAGEEACKSSQLDCAISGPTGNCTLACTEKKACKEMDSTGVAEVQCGADEACRSANFVCPDDDYCSVDCTEKKACKEMTLDCNADNTCVTVCSGSNDETCLDARVNCQAPNPPDPAIMCMVSCQDTKDICDSVSASPADVAVFDCQRADACTSAQNTATITTCPAGTIGPLPYCVECDVAYHCSGRAISVAPDAAQTECVCQCYGGWTGATCTECKNSGMIAKNVCTWVDGSGTPKTTGKSNEYGCWDLTAKVRYRCTATSSSPCCQDTGRSGQTMICPDALPHMCSLPDSCTGTGSSNGMFCCKATASDCDRHGGLRPCVGCQYEFPPTRGPSASPIPPSVAPTQPPRQPTQSPSDAPSAPPTTGPTAAPQGAPSASPTVGPTAAPQAGPTVPPTVGPTTAPQAGPTAAPTVGPTAAPQAGPTAAPTVVPTDSPQAGPTAAPTVVPTDSPQAGPTAAPTVVPTDSPQAGPTAAPTVVPTDSPQAGPTAAPTVVPTDPPQAGPTAAPSVGPTAAPQAGPTAAPSVGPTAAPQAGPTAPPSGPPSGAPQAAPSAPPSGSPTLEPSAPSATSHPSTAPLTAAPSAAPSGPPIGTPSAAPSAGPSAGPSGSPVAPPSASPSGSPLGPSLPPLPPSAAPSGASAAPSAAPIGLSQSPQLPSAAPLSPSLPPTSSPLGPSQSPANPTANPTNQPITPGVPTATPQTSAPSVTPSTPPTLLPTDAPADPTSAPLGPSAAPSQQPSSSPSSPPTDAPAGTPTLPPSRGPSPVPSPAPTQGPSLAPSQAPRAPPSRAPSAPPSAPPNAPPSAPPTQAPSDRDPSSAPSAPPSRLPSADPTAPPVLPSAAPSLPPSGLPSGPPTLSPQGVPSVPPTAPPQGVPSVPPTAPPQRAPSRPPSWSPRGTPSRPPSWSPLGTPSRRPSWSPQRNPSASPSIRITLAPMVPLTMAPAVPLTMAPVVPITFAPMVPPSVSPSAPPAPPTEAPSGPSAPPSRNPSMGALTLAPAAPSTAPTAAPANATAAPVAPATFAPSAPAGAPSTSPVARPTAPPVPPSASPIAGPSASPTSAPTETPAGAGLTPAERKEATLAIDTIAGGNVASSMALGAASGGAAGKLAIVKGVDCAVEDVDLDESEPLDWEFSPTGTALGGGPSKYFLGAVVMNPVIVTCFFAAQALLMVVLKYVCKQTTSQAMGTAKFPGFLQIPVIFLLQGTSLSASNIAFSPEKTNYGVVVALGWLALLCCMAVPCLLYWFVLRKKVLRAKVEDDPRLADGHPNPLTGCKRRLYIFIFGQQVWVTAPRDTGPQAKEDYFAEQWGQCFEMLREDWQWVAVVDMAVMLALSVCAAWKANPGPACHIRNGILLFFLGGSMILYGWKRPFISVFDNVYAIALSVMMFVAVFFIALSIITGGGMAVALEMVAHMLFMSAMLVLFKVLFDIIVYIADLVMSRRAEARRIAREKKHPATVSPLLAPSDEPDRTAARCSPTSQLLSWREGLSVPDLVPSSSPALEMTELPRESPGSQLDDGEDADADRSGVAGDEYRNLRTLLDRPLLWTEQGRKDNPQRVLRRPPTVVGRNAMQVSDVLKASQRVSLPAEEIPPQGSSPGTEALAASAKSAASWPASHRRRRPSAGRGAPSLQGRVRSRDLEDIVVHVRTGGPAAESPAESLQPQSLKRRPQLRFHTVPASSARVAEGSVRGGISEVVTPRHMPPRRTSGTPAIPSSPEASMSATVPGRRESPLASSRIQQNRTWV